MDEQARARAVYDRLGKAFLAVDLMWEQKEPKLLAAAAGQQEGQGGVKPENQGRGRAIKKEQLGSFFMANLFPAAGVPGLNTSSNGNEQDSVWRLQPRFPGDVKRFLNRLLGLSLADQKLAFGLFQAKLDDVVAAAKSSGEYDSGIASIRGPLEVVERKVLHTDQASGAETVALTVSEDRGLSWGDACRMLQEAKAAAAQRGQAVSEDSGFYIDRRDVQEEEVVGYKSTGHPRMSLVVQAVKLTDSGAPLFYIRKPYDGFNKCARPLDEVLKTLCPAQCTTPTRAQDAWDFWYGETDVGCCYGPECSALKKAKKGKKGEGSKQGSQGSRPDTKDMQQCSHPTRRSTINMISGAVLPIWKVIYDTTEEIGRVAVLRLPDNATNHEKRQARSRHQASALRGTLRDGTPITGLTMHDRAFQCVLDDIEDVNQQPGGVEALARRRSIWGSSSSSAGGSSQAAVWGLSGHGGAAAAAAAAAAAPAAAAAAAAAAAPAAAGSWADDDGVEQQQQPTRQQQQPLQQRRQQRAAAAAQVQHRRARVTEEASSSEDVSSGSEAESGSDEDFSWQNNSDSD